MLSTCAEIHDMRKVFLALLCLAPFSASAAITFNFIYADTGSGFGFDDPVEGATRKATVNAVATYINTVIDHTATVDIRWNASINDPGSFTLGSMGTSYYLNRGVYGGILRDRILNNNNPNADSDGSGQINFGQTWNSDHTRNVAPGESDLFSVVLHELTHAMGFSSLIASDGTPEITGTYSLYDTMLRDSENGLIISATGEFVGEVADLTSETLQIQTGSGLIQIY